MRKPDEPRRLALCFQVHQPRRLKKHEPGETAGVADCFDDVLNREIMERMARQCYVPANNLLMRLIDQYPDLRFTFGISGTAIDQMELFAPEAIESFRKLAQTGCVDFLSEPYYHSLAFLMDGEEFEIQILEHAEKLYEHFQARPTVFRNTNLIYNDEIGRRISMMGFGGTLIEGNASRRTSPHFLYEHRDGNGLKLLLRNHHLSDDIAFRVAAPEWNLTAEKFMSWLEEMPDDEKLVTIALDYGTFGEHHGAESGIFDFLERLLLLLAMQNNHRMITAGDAVTAFSARDEIAIPDYAMVEGCDLHDWVGNDRQREAFSAISELETPVKRLQDPAILSTWRNLQCSDHFFYMSEGPGACALSPFASSQDAFHYFMSAAGTLKKATEDREPGTEDPERINETLEAERRNVNAPIWALSIDPQHGHNN